jgi:hypothetical protein
VQRFYFRSIYLNSPCRIDPTQISTTATVLHDQVNQKRIGVDPPQIGKRSAYGVLNLLEKNLIGSNTELGDGDPKIASFLKGYLLASS